MARRILVAVDNPIQAEHVRLLLEGAGYLVHMAANGREGLQSAQSAPPDLIISDVGLPEVDGYAFCRAVKSDEATKRIPFVLLTKRKSAIDIVHGLEIGADNFIIKPFDDEYLLERVRRIFEHLEFRRKGYLEVEVTVHVAGRDISITADKQQIIELLFASFEELERTNARLVESQRIVERHAEELEAEVDRRARQLRETEEMYRTLIENLPVVTYTAALDGMSSTLYISPQVEAMLGFSPVEWLADPELWPKQLHPRDRERVLAEWAKATASGGAFYAEYRIHARNGEVVWLRDQAVMALDDTGQPRFMHGFVQDISSRKRAEEVLRVSHERYRTLVENAPLCIHEIDSAGRLISMNPAGLNMMGATDEGQVCGMAYLDVVSRADRSRVDGLLARAFAGESSEFEFVAANEDEPRILASCFVPLREKEGPVQKIMGITQDITDRKQAEQTLEHSRALLQSFVEHTPAAVAMFDKKLRYVAVSRRWLYDYRLADQDIIGRHHYDVFPEIRGLKEWQEVHQRCLAGAVERRDEERFVRQDGSEDWLRWEVRPWYDISGEVAGIIMFTEVITERKLAEATHQALSQRLVEVQEGERRSIARELHDEIGQVLTGLKLTLEMAGRLPAEAFKTSLDEAQALVDDLMIRVRELSLDLRPAMLDDLGLLPTLLWHIERYRARTNARVSFKQNGLEGRRFSSNLETTIYRIVQEALTNVARHAGVCEVVVLVWVRQDAIVVQIGDHGMGFDPKTVLSAGETSGLAGMRERAALMGGHLTIDSAPGTGTRITAELPLGDLLERRLKERKT